MDFKAMMKTESKCIEEHAPQCQATCPLHIDMRGLIRLGRAGDIAAAAALFQKQAFFPRLVAKCCTAPCQGTCKRREAGESIAIHQLENWLAQKADFATAPIVPYMKLKQRVAVVGGGMSSLGAAWYLYEKGFQITVYEKSAALGGQARHLGGVTEEDIQADCRPLLTGDVTFQYQTEIGKDITYAQLLEDFDAIYIGGGKNLETTGLSVNNGCLAVDEKTFQSREPKVFAGSSAILGDGAFCIATAIAHGRRAAISIDRFLKNVSLTAARKQEEPYTTELYTNTKDIEPSCRVQAQSGLYTDGEAAREMARCLDCRCMECVKQCKFLEKNKKYPRKYIREIANTVSLLGGGLRSGRGLVLSCTLCGLCQELCPNSIPMPAVSLSGRQEMHKKNELPEAFYDFPVRDMLFSNSDAFQLCRHQPGTEESKYLFFPGCQMAASTPQYIAPVYRHLQQKLAGGVGLFLGCCGAPADWAGRQDLFQKTINQLLEQWEGMGKPVMIVGCTTCLQQFKGSAPGLEVMSLWEVFADYGLPKVPHTHGNIKKIALHDPCTARYETDIQEYVREILLMCDYEVEELAYSREKTRCCGYGGLVFYGNRDMAKEFACARVEESTLDFVAYCSVCRDYFARAGKTTFHLLDVIFGNDNKKQGKEKGPNISEKENNRYQLKRQLTKEFWGEEALAEAEGPTLYINDGLWQVLEDRLITEKNIRMVIEAAEKTGNKLVRPGDGHYFACLRPHIITYWVEYLPEGSGYRVFNAYCHRIQIVEE